MRVWPTLLLILVIGPSLSGCGFMLKKWEKENSFAVAAEPLDSDLVKTDPAKFTPPGTKKEFIGRIVDDSESKCSNFLNGLVLSETSTNTGLDIFTTIFSALGTAFTPVSTIHALAAGATITSGSKTAIDSDIYAKASISNFAQAIQASYYKDINNYMNALGESNEGNIIVSIEIGKIRTIHKECSLASAESTISATIANPPAQSITTETDKWMVAKTVKKGDVLKLIAHSATFTSEGNDITTGITAKSNKASDLAIDVVNAVNQNDELKTKNISAAKETDGLTIDLISPKSAAVTWRVDGTAKADLVHQTTSSAPAASSNAAGSPKQNLKSPSSGVTTKGVVPGSPL